MVRVDDRVWLIWVLWVLILPINLLCSALFAAIVHELAHICAIYLLGGSVRHVFLAPLGARIEAEGIYGLREAICALAGPAGSFSMLLQIHKYPILGLCGFAQGLYNLLPLYPLDGGRALRRILEVVFPIKYARVLEFALACLFLAVYVAMALMFL